jgi:hypothetical protein
MGQTSMLTIMHNVVPMIIVDILRWARANTSSTRKPDTETKLNVRINIIAP